MRRHATNSAIGVLSAAVLGVPAAAWSADAPPPEAVRRAEFGRALARIGRSGLRSLLSSSGNLGDLRNRAASYRMAVHLETARTAALEGRIAALDRALGEPDLPAGTRAALSRQLEAARSELEAIPRYEANYRAVTAQAEGLSPLGFIGHRPVFLLLRGRGHARWAGADGLTVFSEAVSAGPLVVASDRWVVAPALALVRTDAEIGPFDGRSASSSLGPRLDLGVIGDGWSAAVRATHTWGREESAVVRPGPEGGTDVRTERWSRTTSARAELKGRLPLAAPGAATLTLRPRFGGFLLASRRPPVTNSLGERSVGPFGEGERMAVVRLGTGLEASVGSWSPSLYVGWERELDDEMSALVDDPTALLVSVGVSRSWGRGRRFAVDYALVRGLEGLRRVSELTLVLVLDG